MSGGKGRGGKEGEEGKAGEGKVKPLPPSKNSGYGLAISHRQKPVESHSGARETIIAGPYHNFIPYAPRSRRRREET